MEAEFSISHTNGRKRVLDADAGAHLLLLLAAVKKAKRNDPVEGHLTVIVPMRRSVILLAAQAGIVEDVS